MIVVALVGLWLPGYALARALRAPFAWAAAFPVSALLLAESVIFLAIVDLPIRFVTALASVTLVTVASLAVVAYRRRNPDASRAESPDVDGGASSPMWLVAAVGALVLMILAGLALRSTLYPLSGFDTVFRWEALSRLMLEEQSLAFYPPSSSSDFAKYTYPDGTAPLVATVYWWLYSGWGAPFPALTSIAVCLQAVSCFALVYYAARTLYGATGGLIAAGALAGSSLFVYGVVIGQETGFTALSYAGQLAFAIAATRRPQAGSVILAGLFAGIGALAREYGPALALCGFFVLVAERSTRRYVLLFMVVAVLCGAPWYVRNWSRTGNPLYPLDPAGLGLPVNAVQSLLNSSYGERFGPGGFTIAKWGALLLNVLAGAPMAIVFGVMGAVASKTRGLPLLAAAAAGAGLWIWSIPYTVGGVEYSMRVLTPTVVALSVACGAWGPLVAPMCGLSSSLVRRALFGVVTTVLLIGGAYTVLYCATFPAAIQNLPAAIRDFRNTMFSRREYPVAQLGGDLDVVKILNESGLPPERVLTDNCYLATALRRSSRFQPVMIWSPEAAFIFDKSLDATTVRQRLRDDRIWYVSVAPTYEFVWARYPFFAVDGQHWQTVNGTSEFQAVYFLPLVKE